MTWAGLDTTTLLQAAGALFVSLLLLHLLRVRRRRVVVAHAALWFDVTTEGRAHSLLRRLRRQLVVRVASEQRSLEKFQLPRAARL